MADKDGWARKTEGIQERATNERKRGTKGRERASAKTEWQKEIRWKKLEQLPPLESTATTANRHYRLRNPHQGSTVSHFFFFEFQSAFQAQMLKIPTPSTSFVNLLLQFLVDCLQFEHTQSMCLILTEIFVF